MSEGPTITTGLGVTIPAAPRRSTTRPRPTIRRGKRTFRGFAVLDAAGNLVWGSLRTTEKAALAAFQRWNPSIQGFEMNERAVSVTITLDDRENLTIRPES